MTQKDILYWALFAFAVVGPAYLIYGLLIRRTLLLQMRNEILAVSDRLELMVKAGRIGRDDAELKILRARCATPLAVLYRLDIAHLFLADRTPSYLQAKEAFHVEESALKNRPELYELAQRVSRSLACCLAINSPAFLVLGALVILPLAVFGGIGKYWTRTMARILFTASNESRSINGGLPC